MHASLLQRVHDFMLGWPLIIYVLAVGAICTVAFRFIQFRYFFAAWADIFKPSSGSSQGEMTPLQALINTLNASIGNGSIAGMATAVYAGGPGAAFWVVAIGFILMAARFAEVYLGIESAASGTREHGFGGPMLYLQQIPGGTLLAYLYAIGCLLFCFMGGNAMQTNSITISINSAFHISPLIIASIILLFIAYIVWGGAARIIKASETIVPIKVGAFFIFTFIALAYHYQMLWSSLVLIAQSAFTPIAMAGGVVGFSVQQAMQFGIMRAIQATESGVGTAAIFFGATGSRTPIKDGVMSMLGTFLSTTACFLVALCIIASGVLEYAVTHEIKSTALTCAAYTTVFGSFGGILITFLSISFGIGVLVVYAFLARECWLFLTGGRFPLLFNLTYCAVAFFGALMNVDTLWSTYGLITAFLLIINLFGILYLIPTVRSGLAHAKA
jgi:AGCS family alanine or glycine:cation symporter